MYLTILKPDSCVSCLVVTFELGVTQASDHSMVEAETGGLRIQGEHWLNSNVLFKERKSDNEMSDVSI